MIRAATPADLPDIADMGERFAREGPYSQFLRPDRAAMLSLARALMTDPRGLLLVSDRDAKATGMIGALITPHPYSGALVMNEMFWYVSPEDRGSGVRLLRAAEAWGRTQSAGLLIMVSPDERVSAFLTRTGYRPLETHFIKSL